MLYVVSAHSDNLKFVNTELFFVLCAYSCNFKMTKSTAFVAMITCCNCGKDAKYFPYLFYANKTLILMH